jgi:hypothetical protein
MRLLRVFIAHEATTQWRSVRFRLFAFVYVLLSILPAVLLRIIAARSTVTIGSAAYAAFNLALQPMLTALLALLLAIDGLTRERDENSFAVLGVAPLSSAGYLLRRWIAIVAVCLPLTIVPQLVTAAIATQALHRPPLVAAYLGGWLLRVVPALLLASALALAGGTIAGRTVLAILLGAFLFTAGVGLANIFLASRHLHLEVFGPSADINFRQGNYLIWALRGNWMPPLPTEAAYPLRYEVRLLWSHRLLVAVAAAFLGIAAFYLRRTRRDIRPLKIREDHQLRTFLRTINRVREEYTPDGGMSALDLLVLLGGLAIAGIGIGGVLRDQQSMLARGAQRLQLESNSSAAVMTRAIVPLSLAIDGDVALDGTISTRSTLTLRNDSAQPQPYLVFDLNPPIDLADVRAARGSARVRRVWQRVDVTLDPPLAAGESRELRFVCRGTPGTWQFNLPYGRTFVEAWRRFMFAKDSSELSDLSQSTLDPDIDERQMELTLDELTPMPRYTPFTTVKIDWQEPEMRGESFAIPVRMKVVLRHPFSYAADACGASAKNGVLKSDCITALPSYRVFGGPLHERTLSGATFAAIDAHSNLARLHAPALEKGLATATTSWPNLTLPHRILFIERPSAAGERLWVENADFDLRLLASHGAMMMIPESMVARLKSIEPGVIAAALIARTLGDRRRVVADQQQFFGAFFETVAFKRSSGRRSTATVGGGGVPPSTTSLLDAETGWHRDRMHGVLADLEYRVGADHFAEGVNEFVAAGPGPGDARQLIDAIGRHGHVDLAHFYTDFIEGTALPKLTLIDVKFARSGGAWQVAGTLRNDGTGEALVPVALRTARGAMWKTLRIGRGERVPFAFDTTDEPRSVQIDPDRVVYRWAAVGTVEVVDFRGNV